VPAPPLPSPAETAFFIDVDGTLIDIASTPEGVRVAPRLPALLERLRDRCGGALAVVSGRRLVDIDRLLQPLVAPAAGVHGLERRRADGSVVRLDGTTVLGRVRDDLTRFVAGHPGVRLEDKDLSVALHYRLAPHEETAVRDAARRAVAPFKDDIKLLEGKMVVEVKPQGANKGTAVAAFLAEAPFAGRRPVFLGDDVTDEDGFAAADRAGGMSILVGERPSAARWRLPSVAAVHHWLGEIVERECRP
jgi:trehalose 6-phosphate phosphatase